MRRSTHHGMLEKQPVCCSPLKRQQPLRKQLHAQPVTVAAVRHALADTWAPRAPESTDFGKSQIVTQAQQISAILHAVRDLNHATCTSWLKYV
jgi:hypothetical protein